MSESLACFVATYESSTSSLHEQTSDRVVHAYNSAGEEVTTASSVVVGRSVGTSALLFLSWSLPRKFQA